MYQVKMPDRMSECMSDKMEEYMSDSQIECQDIYYIYYMSDKMKESTISCQECMADRIIERHNAGIFVR